MKDDDENFSRKLPAVNWIGLITGILMLVLPFRGPWWRIEVGNNVASFAFSPFYYKVSIIGVHLTSNLVNYLVLASQLAVVFGGAFLIVGSITRTRWWGRKLVDWGSMKFFWTFIFITILVILGSYLANNFLIRTFEGFIGEKLPLDIKLPYFVGEGMIDVEIEDSLNIKAPIELSLKPTYWFALITAALGPLTRFALLDHNEIT